MRGGQPRDISVSYIDGLWTHRIGSDFFPDGPRFDYTGDEYDSWRGRRARQQADTNEYWLKYYEPREGDVIIDVGAGRGEDTYTFSRAVGPLGCVIAIEAHPVSFAILKSFSRLNNLLNVTALHLALMDKPGHVGITDSELWQENAVDLKGSSLTRVPAATLDDLCRVRNVSHIDFVKMNIEGAERHALLGMKAMMASIDKICVACHDFRADLGHGEELRTRAFVEDFLTKSGFKVFSRREDPRDYVRDHVFGLK